MMSFFHNLKFIHITLTVDGYRGSLNRQEGCLQHLQKPYLLSICSLEDDKV